MAHPSLAVFAPNVRHAKFGVRKAEQIVSRKIGFSSNKWNVQMQTRVILKHLELLPVF
jgi:hypothetical protein